jgi:hypothetical protein
MGCVTCKITKCVTKNSTINKSQLVTDTKIYEISHGASTVDYVLVLEGILDHILSLKVNDFVPCLSDCHCLIQWSISAKYSNKHVHIENCNTIETSPGYKKIP